MLDESLLISPRKSPQSFSKSAMQNISRFADPNSELKECFIDFSSKFQYFFSLFPQTRIDPKIMVQFKLLSKSFELFYHQYSHKSQKVSLNESSPLFTFAKSFSDDWVEFIHFYIVVANMGTAPQLTEINSSFDLIYNSLCELRQLMNDEKFKTDVGCKAILSVQNKSNAIRKEIQRLFIKSDDPIEAFDEIKFTKKMKDLGNEISKMFMHSLTHQCLKRGEKNKINANLNAACLGLKENVIAAMEIPKTEFETRKAIISLNTIINDEFKKLKIPYFIDIDFENSFRNKIDSLLNQSDEKTEEFPSSSSFSDSN